MEIVIKMEVLADAGSLRCGDGAFLLFVDSALARGPVGVASMTQHGSR